MPPIRVRSARFPKLLSLTTLRLVSSVYQDIQMYSVEQFIELSPPEAHTQEALSDEHQLMLNRLGFELVERQRFDSEISIGRL